MGIIGHVIIEIEEADSTNLYAERLLQQEAVEEGTVIVAYNQTEGRGQGENRWYSEPGLNLTLTIVLRPSFLLAGQQFLINKVISLGVYNFLCNYIEDVSIKWPNDMLIEGKKVGGILIQHTVSNEMLETTIAGIGINVNQKHFDPQLPNATSLKRVLGQELVLNEALNQLCTSLEIQYAAIKEGTLDLLESYYCKALLGFDEKRMYRVDNETVEGVINGVDEFGRLLVEVSGKPVQPFNHKEIEYIL